MSTKAEAATIARFIVLLQDQGGALARVSTHYVRLIDKRELVYELRPGDHRIAYAEHKGKFVLLHIWRKKSQKLDRKQANIALQRLATWRARY